MLKKDYERCQKNKEEKKGKEIITPEQKSNLLLEFINKEKRIPVKSELFKEVQLGNFWDSIKHGHNNKIYKNYLEKNEMLKKHYERCQKNKEEKKGKEIITPEQKCNLLLEFINKENRLPTQKEIYKEVKLGSWWDSIKHGHNNKIYKNYLEKNEMLKKHYERCQKK